ncbi:MAG TPA: helix-turn-helix domain-containing protein, partial [Flavisolibacter sp.]|nr:helix-turn-helix domain-containing protein [Flavisolibacter sp.]
KTDVRVITATNKDLLQLVQNGKFREDLYYRLNTVPIRVPALRDRKEDITTLFRKFVVDFAERYKTTPVQLEEDARQILVNYPFPGNVRELKNLAEQISVLAREKQVNAKELGRFLPEHEPVNRLPVLAHHNGQEAHEFSNEREILYKLFFDMKRDVTELKKMFFEMMQNPAVATQNPSFLAELRDMQRVDVGNPMIMQNVPQAAQPVIMHNPSEIHEHVEVDESLNIMDKEKELIIKALKKHKNKRKDAAMDLGISERTLYRKLKEYDIDQ